MADSLSSYAGPCWRAVASGLEADVLAGTTRAGRYNRPGEPTLYMSGSPEGAAAAMARYGDLPRTIVEVSVEATRLVDLRDAGACVVLGIDLARAKGDWLAAIDQKEEPASWAVSDRARALGAQGLIDGSRRFPGAWHLVLFQWNDAGGARVAVA